ncbi:MAG: helix-turn-helix domain-containing protein [Acidobacteria bacterium]|nr:helix-turn-helix domain-containing protein [Acidobacteriota bacterium]
MTFGRTLQEIRRKKGLTQRDVADAISMDYSYYSKLENDRLGFNPTRETVEKIVTGLKCDDEEKDALLLAAGRSTEVFEEMARAAKQDPSKQGSFSKLFKAAIVLTPEKLEEIAREAEQEAKKLAKRRPKQ